MGSRGPPGRIPTARSGPKRGPKGPERVPNGASEKGKDDPEAEGLKKEGAKSSKMSTIQKRALNGYGKHILKESLSLYEKVTPMVTRSTFLRSKGKSIVF